MLTLGVDLGAFRAQKSTQHFLDSTLSHETRSLTHKLNTNLAHKWDGYWCWAYPEEALDHWHSYEGGFRSRVPVDQRPGVQA